MVLEPYRFDTIVKKELMDLGYQLNERNSRVIGKVAGILRLSDGSYEGGADPRGDDTAIGF